MEDKVQEIMRLLSCDEVAARQVIEDDKRIDKGEKLFEQTAEQKANSKKYRQADRKPTVYSFQKRERKADEDKRHLVEVLAAALAAEGLTYEVTNPERQIDFTCGDRKFRIVLSAPRS